MKLLEYSISSCKPRSRERTLIQARVLASMAEASTHTTTKMQLFSDWEIQLLILLSFALQVFLFFCGGLRRRNNHMLLRITIWLSYLSADFMAAYALGHLSRNVPTTDENHKPIARQLTILWAPFLLIHLGGQDTVTAFSLEDNELWLRHLLNLLGQACLVVYLLCKWVALAQYQLVIPAAFLFVAGIIKYGERIWALKLGSQKGLRTSTSRDVMKESLSVEIPSWMITSWNLHHARTRQTYQELIRYTLHTEHSVREIFAGRKLNDMEHEEAFRFSYLEQEGNVIENEEWLHRRQALIGDAQESFKRAEIELSTMYDSLFTKSRVIQTRPGGILRCVSLASTVVAFVLYVKMMMSSSADAEQTASAKTYNDYRGRRSGVDAAITYMLFTGAFCLEACSCFIVMMSPSQWPVMEARAGCCCRVLLARVAWPIFMKIQPETKPWWSNSMGQYNLASSFGNTRKRSRDSKWSCTCTMVMTKMAGVFGASELWNKIRNTKHAQVTREIKELIHDSIGSRLEGRPKRIRVPSAYRDIFSIPFEEALLQLYLWTELVAHKAEACKSTQGQEAEALRGRLMDTCKRLSNYMLYLLVEHPAILPTRTNTQDLLGRITLWAHRSSIEEEVDFFEVLANNIFAGSESMPSMHSFWAQRAMLKNEGGIHAELERLEQVWVRMLLYAAGKSRPEEHARRLSTGGELITFVWLLMAHQSMGDVSMSVSLIASTGDSSEYCLMDDGFHILT